MEKTVLIIVINELKVPVPDSKFFYQRMDSDPKHAKANIVLLAPSRACWQKTSQLLHVTCVTDYFCAIL